MKNKFKITFNSPVILTFTALCLIATILNYVTRGKSNQLLFMTYRASLTNPLTYVRLFTHVLGHSGWEHFIGNASYLLLLGPMLEEKYGSKIMIENIAVTAFVTALVNFIFFPHIGLCGASGVVFAFIILTSFTSFQEGEIPLTFILVVVIYIGQQVVEGLFTHDNISQMGHIVGGIVGAVLGYNLNKKA